jgi:hypothetical protein
MGKIIKAIWERCKSKFIDWLLDSLRDYFNLSQLVFIMPVLAWIQGIPSFYWFPILVFTCALFPYGIKGFVFLSNYFDKPVLEIIYDNGRYNKRKNIQIKATYDIKMPIHNCFFYIVGIHNIGKKTINAVSVIIDGNKCIHDNGQYVCDINPGSIELFDMYGETIENQKRGTKITITVTGKDIKPTIKTITL